jgi:hypothetical protein
MGISGNTFFSGIIQAFLEATLQGTDHCMVPQVTEQVVSLGLFEPSVSNCMIGNFFFINAISLKLFDLQQGKWREIWETCCFHTAFCNVSCSWYQLQLVQAATQYLILSHSDLEFFISAIHNAVHNSSISPRWMNDWQAIDQLESLLGAGCMEFIVDLLG